LYESVEELNIEIGVITTPASAAQHVADRFLEAQVNAILNFSPTRISVPDCCLVENVDFTVKLDILTCKLCQESVH
jgi:redox-sensing transcriptional repressor